jgi:8-oxo-dGTP diphosphatase
MCVVWSLPVRHRGDTQIVDAESSTNLPPVFGARLAGVDYPESHGAYAIIRDDDGRVAVVESGGALHLPGGGVEAGESNEQALLRECLEECGFAVEVLDFVGRAAQYAVSRQGETFARICDYFRARVVRSECGKATASAERLLWVTVDEAAQGLAHEAHAWAVRKATACEW